MITVFGRAREGGTQGGREGKGGPELVLRLAQRQVKFALNALERMRQKRDQEPKKQGNQSSLSAGEERG